MTYRKPPPDKVRTAIGRPPDEGRPTPVAFPGASTKKRGRPRGRTVRLQELAEALVPVVADVRPATVRQVYYQAVARSLVPKTTASYRQVQRLLVDLRREGVIPYGWIADYTRWIRKPNSHHSIQAALEDTVAAYRRALWREQECRVEVWIEKDALTGVVYGETASFDVPLMSAKGYSSETFAWIAAEQARASGKHTFYYYFGDHDAYGIEAAHKLEEKLSSFLDPSDFTFRLAALTREQIEELGLPSTEKPAQNKKERQFNGPRVDLDAVPPDVLRSMVRECITRHIDPNQWEATMRFEEYERQTAEDLVSAWEAA